MIILESNLRAAKEIKKWIMAKQDLGINMDGTKLIEEEKGVDAIEWLGGLPLKVEKYVA